MTTTAARRRRPLMRPLGLRPKPRQGLCPLDPGFFRSGVKGEAELETKDQTLITAGT